MLCSAHPDVTPAIAYRPFIQVHAFELLSFTSRLGTASTAHDIRDLVTLEPRLRQSLLRLSDYLYVAQLLLALQSQRQRRPSTGAARRDDFRCSEQLMIVPARIVTL